MLRANTKVRLYAGLCSVFIVCFLCYLFIVNDRATVHDERRVVHLNLDDLGSFEDTYFPSAPQSWTSDEMSRNIQSLQGAVVVVRRGQRECVYDCRLVLLQPGSNGRYSVHFNGSAVKELEAVHLAGQLCDVVELPKERLQEWYRRRNATHNNATFLQVGRFEEREISIEIHESSVETGSLRVHLAVEL